MKTRSILITGGILILAALALGTLMPFLLPTPVGGSTYGWMMGPGMMAGFGWLGMLVMALFWVGVVLLVVWGLSNLFPARQATGEPDALEILKRRYARGEISREEFLQAREALQ